MDGDFDSWSKALWPALRFVLEGDGCEGNAMTTGVGVSSVNSPDEERSSAEVGLSDKHRDCHLIDEQNVWDKT